MNISTDLHGLFAAYFKDATLEPYLYLLSKKLSEGSICIDLETIDKTELPEKFHELNISKNEIVNHKLVSNGESVLPVVYVNERLYFYKYFKYEATIFERISGMLQTEKSQIEFWKTELIKQTLFFQSLFNNKSNIIDWQKVAAIISIVHKFSIITGGPGTGKTTTVSKILATLFSINPNMKVALTAPTGKAAARMLESLNNTAKKLPDEIKLRFDKMQAYTLHRLLGMNNKVEKSIKSFLPFDIVIVDESSMIDAVMFAKLLSGIGANTKLIMLGDKDQLAAVGAGSLFGDLCIAHKELSKFNSETVSFINSFSLQSDSNLGSDEIAESTANIMFEHIVELRESHRFNADNGIGLFSSYCIKNDIGGIKDFFKNNEPAVKIDTRYDEKIFFDFIKGFEEFLLEENIEAAFKKLFKLKVLCAVRQGDYGVSSINKKIEKFLVSKKLINTNIAFYHNRPVMILENDYRQGLFNGDIGIVRKDEKNIFRIWFLESDGSLKSVLPAFISEVETAFACTIHKSQGSEFDKVMVVLPANVENNLLTRELLYTGVTRARNEVVIVASEETILNSVSKKVQRSSGLAARL